MGVEVGWEALVGGGDLKLKGEGVAEGMQLIRHQKTSDLQEQALPAPLHPRFRRHANLRERTWD
jgi:hypothetical protein